MVSVFTSHIRRSFEADSREESERLNLAVQEAKDARGPRFLMFPRTIKRSRAAKIRGGRAAQLLVQRLMKEGV